MFPPYPKLFPAESFAVTVIVYAVFAKMLLAMPVPEIVEADALIAPTNLLDWFYIIFSIFKIYYTCHKFVANIFYKNHYITQVKTKYFYW